MRGKHFHIEVLEFDLFERVGMLLVEFAGGVVGEGTIRVETVAHSARQYKYGLSLFNKDGS